MQFPIYLDYSATTPVDPRVAEKMSECLTLEANFGNPASRSHMFGWKAEEAVENARRQVADLLHCDPREIVWTSGATEADNLAIKGAAHFHAKKGKHIITSKIEHKAVLDSCRQLEREGFEVTYVDVDKDFNLDFEDFEKKYNEKVKIISMTHVSNITWQIFDLERIWKLKREDTIFIIDASQSVPHFKVDVKLLNADFLIFTWHKVFADTGIWILWWKESYLNELKPNFSWWWAVSKVDELFFSYAKIPYKFEPWTPNISWAISLSKALDYIEEKWWFNEFEKIENELVEYSLIQFKKRGNIKIVWSDNSDNRVGVFTFFIDWVHSHDIADVMADNNICIRAWLHCAHPFLNKYDLSHTSRMSLYIYNTREDIDKFFEILDNFFK